MRMRKLVALLCLLACCGEAAALEPDQLFKLISPSVWLVRTFDADGLPRGAGSAVVIRPGKLITNCHVLGKASAFSLIKERVSYKGKLEEVDLERDFCLVSVADERFDAPLVKLADSDQLVVGQRVVTLGNPRALEMTLSDGLISRLQRDDDGQLEAIQTSAPFSPGSSGGGLFDMDGRLIGITQRINVSTGSQNLNFALPINWLRDLPARSKAQLDEYRAASKSATGK
ncbi:serine protease [Uliginosibacterium sp. H3]|uniref:Serine protease n=1 Tax=Uliginosibacterium silvisoli TaxID=3114758 RepID=A0ABU6JXF1_9RHOO|nr:serine protease [Uliginosibacterium sp. H3]